MARQDELKQEFDRLLSVYVANKDEIKAMNTGMNNAIDEFCSKFQMEPKNVKKVYGYLYKLRTKGEDDIAIISSILDGMGVGESESSD